MMKNLAIVILALTALSCGAASPADDLAAQGSVGQSQGLPSPSESSAGEQCQYPSKQPSYLPWLAEGEEPGSPERGGFNEQARFFWAPTNAPKWEGTYVSFWTETEQPYGPGEPVTVEYQGIQGSLSVGPGDVATVSIIWQSASDSACNTTVLTLNSPALELDEAKEELRKVARSLR